MKKKATFKHVKYRVGFILLIVLLLLINISFAVTQTTTSFYNQANPFNITFEGGDNQSYYIPIPRYAYVENVSIDLVGITNYNWSETIGSEKFVGVHDNISQWFYNGISFSRPSAENMGGSFRLIGQNAPHTGVYNYTTTIYMGNNIENFKLNLSLYNYTRGNFQTIGYDNVTLTSDNNWSLSVYLNSSEITSDFLNNGLYNFSIYTTLTDPDQASYSTDEWVFNKGLLRITIESIDLFLAGEYLDDIDESSLYSINITKLNNILSNNCPSPSYIDGDYCNINTTFYSDTPGILEVNLTNATYSFGVDNCSNSFDIPSNSSAFNLTAKDQLDGDNIASNISYEITYGSGNIYAGSEEKTTYQFCKYPAWYNQSGEIYADIDVSGYNPYTFNRYDIYFSSQNYYAYLLKEDIDHSQISYKVIDVNNEPVENALFLVYRSIGGIDTLVFEGKTDITGQVNLYQDTTYQYNYIILATGFPQKNFSLQPQEQTSEPDYNIKISTESTSYFDNPYQGIRYKHIPEDILFNNSGEWVNLSFVLQGNNLEEVGMRFTDHNFTCIPASCEDIVYEANGGTVTVSILMNQTGVLTGAYWFKLEGEQRIYVNDNKIKVGNFVDSTLKKLTQLIQDIKDNTTPNQRTILTTGISVAVIGLAAALGLFGALLIIPAVLINIVLSLPAVGLINPFVGMIISIFGIVMFILFSMSSRTI